MPPHPADPIDRYLRHCLAARWAPAALDRARALRDAGALDPAALRDALRAGGVGPLIYAVTRGRDVLPPTLEDELKLAYFQVARSNLLRFQELGRVLRALEDAGIPALVLKGAALAEAVYESLGARPMCDADLLVRQRDAPAALAALDALGYVSVHAEARPGDTLAYENEVMLRHPVRPNMPLELHWSLFDSPHHQHTIPHAWFWETARAFKLEGVPARMLGPEAQVLHLCGHAVLHHGRAGEQPRLLWRHDVAEVVARYRAEIAWDDLLARAQAYDLVVPVQQVLRDAPGVPVDIAARLRALEPSPTEARILAWRTAAHRPVAHRFWADLAAMPSWRERLRYAWHSPFPAPDYMRQRYAIAHRWLVPLYYPYRWWLGLRGLVFRKSWNV